MGHPPTLTSKGAQQLQVLTGILMPSGSRNGGKDAQRGWTGLPSLTVSERRLTEKLRIVMVLHEYIPC